MRRCQTAIGHPRACAEVEVRERNIATTERMPMVGEDLVLGVVKCTAVAEASNLPWSAGLVRLHDTVIAHVREGQGLCSTEPMRPRYKANAVHLGGIPHPAREEHAVADTGDRELERLEEAIQSLLRRPARHSPYGTVTRR